MSVVTYEGTVRNGRVVLPDGVRLADHSMVYVVVPERPDEPSDQGSVRLPSSRLASAADAGDFTMELVGSSGAFLR